MLKLTTKAAYGLIAMRHLAQPADIGPASAKDLAELYGMPQGVLGKNLQCPTKPGLLLSQHDINGGYILAHNPHKITAWEIIRAIEGPLFITSCSSTEHDCDQSSRCTMPRAAAQGRPHLRGSSKPINDLKFDTAGVRQLGTDADRLRAKENTER